jgi:hypothetical protein
MRSVIRCPDATAVAVHGEGALVRDLMDSSENWERESPRVPNFLAFECKFPEEHRNTQPVPH